MKAAAALIMLAVAAPPGGAAPCAPEGPCYLWPLVWPRTRVVDVRGHGPARVTACAFRFLVGTHRVDWRRTPRLSGDAVALSPSVIRCRVVGPR